MLNDQGHFHPCVRRSAYKLHSQAGKLLALAVSLGASAVVAVALGWRAWEDVAGVLSVLVGGLAVWLLLCLGRRMASQPVCGG